MGFAGIVRFDGGAITDEAQNLLSNAVAVRTGDKALVRRTDDSIFVKSQMDSSILGPDALAPIERTDRYSLFAASARLDNRDELASSLGIATADRAGVTDAALLARMLELQNDAGIARCLGAFSFAKWDGRDRRLTLGRDCLGHRAVFFHRNDRFAIFSDVLSVLFALPEVPREIDEVVLANFMAGCARDPRRTFYRGIERTPSRCLVTVDRGGANHRVYWNPNLDSQPAFRRDQDYIDRARELFDQAVAAAISDTSKVAIATSGGLDLSAVAATVARMGGSRSITCYTLVAPPDWQVELSRKQYVDEAGKVEALCRLYPHIDLRFIVRDRLHPDYADDRRFFAQTSIPSLSPLQQPLGPTVWDHALADGHSVFLHGRCGNFGLSWAGDFALQALLRAGAWWQFVHELLI